MMVRLSLTKQVVLYADYLDLLKPAVVFRVIN